MTHRRQKNKQKKQNQHHTISKKPKKKTRAKQKKKSDNPMVTRAQKATTLGLGPDFTFARSGPNNQTFTWTRETTPVGQGSSSANLTSDSDAASESSIDPEAEERAIDAWFQRTCQSDYTGPQTLSTEEVKTIAKNEKKAPRQLQPPKHRQPMKKKKSATKSEEQPTPGFPPLDLPVLQFDKVRASSPEKSISEALETKEQEKNVSIGSSGSNDDVNQFFSANDEAENSFCRELAMLTKKQTTQETHHTQALLEQKIRFQKKSTDQDRRHNQAIEALQKKHEQALEEQKRTDKAAREKQQSFFKRQKVAATQSKTNTLNSAHKKALKKQQTALTHEHQIALTKQQNKFDDQFAARSAQAVTRIETIKELTEKCRRLEKQSQQQEIKNKRQQKTNKQFQADQTKLQQQNGQLETELQKAIDDFDREREDFQAELEQMNARDRELANKNQVLSNRVAEQTQALDKANKSVQVTEAKYSSLIHQLSTQYSTQMKEIGQQLQSVNKVLSRMPHNRIDLLMQTKQLIEKEQQYDHLKEEAALLWDTLHDNKNDVEKDFVVLLVAYLRSIRHIQPSELEQIKAYPNVRAYCDSHPTLALEITSTICTLLNVKNWQWNDSIKRVTNPYRSKPPQEIKQNNRGGRHQLANQAQIKPSSFSLYQRSTRQNNADQCKIIKKI
jgi:hypothetical protein